MTQRYFKAGKSVFQCQSCERQTRITTQHSDTVYCGECEDLFGMQNTLWDDGPLPWMKKERDALMTKIEKRGGDVAKVRAQIPDLCAVS